MPSWLAAIVSTIATFKWAILMLPLLAIGIWIFYEALNYHFFSKFMATIDYPLVRSRRLRSIKATLTRIRDSRFIGGTWFIRRAHSCVLLVAGAILAVSFFRASYTGHSLEFSRSGSLVVIAGLASILIGFLESRMMRKKFEQIIAMVIDDEDKSILEKYMVAPIEHAQFVAARVSVAVSIIGTVTWAYGDQILACGLFPVMNILDKSGVACF